MATNAKVNIGVSGVSEFKRNMKDAESSVKALTSSLELNKKELEATGNKESYLKNQTQILKDAIEAQTAAVQAAESALNQMRKDGVEETSSAFSNMKKRVNENRIKLLDLKSELKKVETQSGDTSAGLENIGKNVAWDNVAEGIGKITDRLQSAARAAINFGKRIGRRVMTSAEWADNLKTEADKWDISPERLQRMRNVADIIDTDVEAILRAQQRMAKAATTKKGISAIEETLGIGLNGQSADDLFWEIGEALVNMGQGFDKEAASQNIFGRSWRELLPLFKAGREEYEKMIDEQKVMSDEDVNRLGALDDTINGLKQQVELMKNQFIADNADKIRDLLQWVIDNQDGVVAALTVIGGGFAALKLAEMAANVAKVVSGFQTLGMVSTGAGGETLFGGASSLITGLGTLLDKFTPLALAVAAGDAFNPGNTEAGKTVKELHNAVKNGEMTPEEAGRAILLHDFGIGSTDEMKKILESQDSNGRFFGTPDNPVEVSVAPVAEEGSAEKISGEIGTVQVAVEPVFHRDRRTGEWIGASPQGFANGIPFVPFDGFPAILHRGERVMPAGENRHYTYNSNTYFGNVNLNNGMDIDNLVHSIDRNNRRKNAGYGG